MEIEQAKAFVSRLSRTGEIPSGLSIALGAIFLRLEEQAAELKKARQEIEVLKAQQAVPHLNSPDLEAASSRLLNQLTSSGLGLGAKF